MIAIQSTEDHRRVSTLGDCFRSLAVLLLAALLMVPMYSRLAGATERREMLASTKWLASSLKASNVTILHVGRDRASYERAHIPGAHFVAWREVAVPRHGVPDELPTLDALVRLARALDIHGITALEQTYDTLAKAFVPLVGGHVTSYPHVVIYDEEIGLAAAQAYVALDYLGLGDRTALLDGGLRAWIGEGRPLSAESPPAHHSNFLPKIRPHVVASSDFVEDIVRETQAFGARGVHLVDARADATPAPPPLPGALRVPWTDHLESREIPRLRPPAVLRRRHTEAGLRTEDLVVVYAATGAGAAHSYFTLKYLGFDVRVFEGGLAEFGGKRNAD